MKASLLFVGCFYFFVVFGSLNELAFKPKCNCNRKVSWLTDTPVRFEKCWDRNDSEE